MLLTGVYGAGKSAVAAEMAYLLEQAGQPYALLDLDYLSWGGAGADDRASEFALMVANLTAVSENYRRAGIPSCSLTLSERPRRSTRLSRRWASRSGWCGWSPTCR